MSATIERLVHPFMRELPLEERDIEGFAEYACCPCCRSDRDPTPLVELGQPSWKRRVAVVQCPDCELVYYRNPPGHEFMANFYREHWNRQRGEAPGDPLAPGRKTSRKLADIVAALGIRDPATRFLDIGCGRAKMMAGLAEAGFPEVWGTEMSQFRARTSEARFPGRVFHGGYEGVPDDLRFDVVYSHHVVEHLQDPAEAFAWMTRHLTDRGIIIIAVPDAWEEPVLNQVLFLPHLHSFSERSLEALGRGNGFACRFWRGALWEEVVAVFDREGSPLAENLEQFRRPDESNPTERRSQVERIRGPWLAEGGADRVWLNLRRSQDDECQRRSGYVGVDRLERMATLLLQPLHRVFHSIGLDRARKRVLGKRGFLQLRRSPAADDVPIIGQQDGRSAFHVK